MNRCVICRAIMIILMGVSTGNAVAQDTAETGSSTTVYTDAEGNTSERRRQVQQDEEGNMRARQGRVVTDAQGNTLQGRRQGQLDNQGKKWTRGGKSDGSRQARAERRENDRGTQQRRRQRRSRD